jgi:putative FmdB family regulatory protein
MPIYEYQCQKCGMFEVTQRITENPLTKCPTCKSRVKKLISNTSFQLKGTGWYITDYARKGQESAKGENGAKSAEAKTDSRGESKTDSKSESKAESKSESKKDATSKSGDKSSSPSPSSTSA